MTGKRSNGFWIQDPSPDSNPATSDGLFVFGSSTVAVGDSVLVSGSVKDFYPLSSGETASSTSNLSVTEIGTPTTIVLSHGNAVPAPEVIAQLGWDMSHPMASEARDVPRGTSHEAVMAGESACSPVLTGVVRWFKPPRTPNVDLTSVKGVLTRWMPAGSATSALPRLCGGRPRGSFGAQFARRRWVTPSVFVAA